MKSYSHVNCNNVHLDKLLDELFEEKTDGFYIELGANDGLFQSNTAYFEFYRNWNGILIEPSLLGYKKCKKNRPNSITLNKACVSNSYKEKYVYGDFKDNHAMGSINGKRLKRKSQVRIEATTLESILDTHLNNNSIDFLSLDTEGYEYNILEGLNFDKYRPKYMLIEIYLKDYIKIYNFLDKNNYKLMENFSNYNKKTNPHWDGTHNDYLFMDNSS